MSPLRQLFGYLSPAGPQGRLSILIFHRVRPIADKIYPDELHAARFTQVCEWLQRWFQVLPLDIAVQRLADGSLPARAAAITFDDGYEDNESIAVPILTRYGLTATFFVATDYLNGGCMWNDTITESIRQCAADSLDLSGAAAGLRSYPLGTAQQRRLAIDDIIRCVKYLTPDDRAATVQALALRTRYSPAQELMMRSDQVRALRKAGMSVGAHTASHPILAKLDLSAARSEIMRSKKVLEGLLNEEVPLFAYPNGRPGTDYLDETVGLVRECGFKAAVSTAWGAADGKTDRFQIPRFTPWDRESWRFGLRLARNLRGANQ